MRKKRMLPYLFLLCLGAVALSIAAPADKSGKIPGKPGADMKGRKVVFIHHSVGGRWLAHDGGGLVSALNARGFYVNDITYGWQPGWMEDSSWKRIRNRVYGWMKHDPGGAYRIGDRTDIGNFPEWFLGKDSAAIMEAVYRENGETSVFGDHSNSRSGSPLKNPGEGIENEVVILKACYPNSLYRGKPEDRAASGENPPRNFPAGSELHTVANCKRVFNDILGYFRTRPDKFFVIVSAPPRKELPENGRIARAFNEWLYHDWLRENGYEGRNVMVFDLYNVLTSGPGFRANDLGKEAGNHHRLWKGREQHIVTDESSVLAYPRDGSDNHPSPAGLAKATGEFADLFVFRYEKWKREGR